VNSTEVLNNVHTDDGSLHGNYGGLNGVTVELGSCFDQSMRSRRACLLSFGAGGNAPSVSGDGGSSICFGDLGNGISVRGLGHV
jgi:hypothetical protein